MTSEQAMAEPIARHNAAKMVELYERHHPDWTRTQIIEYILANEPFCQVAPHERPPEWRFKKRK